MPITADNAAIPPESAAYSSDQSPASFPPKKGRGRPRKDGAPIGSQPAPVAGGIPGPRFTTFYSDHANPAQRTSAAWKWWAGLPDSMKDVCDVTVYRNWPVLLEPEDEEKKYIDKVIGREPIQHDQDFIDRWGAGDYFIFFNDRVAKRTVFTAHIKGSHDFKTYRPTDRRIDDVASVSTTDPQNISYVNWLRATGKIKDELKEDEMAQVNNEATQILGRIAERVIEKENAATPESQPNAADSKATEVVADAAQRGFGIMEKVYTAAIDRLQGNNGDRTSTLHDALEMAKVIAGVNAEKSDEVEKLRLELQREREKREEDRRERESAERKRDIERLNEKIDQLQQAKANTVENPASVESIVEKVAGKLVEEFGLGGKDKEPSLTSMLMQQGIPLLEKFIPALLMNRANGAPMQAPQYAAAQPMNGMAALPPASNPQPAPQPQAPDQVQMLLMGIANPLANYLTLPDDDNPGDAFAAWFTDGYGTDWFKSIAANGPEFVVAQLRAFPMTGEVLSKFPPAKVQTFFEQFCRWTPEPEGSAA